MLRKKQSKWRSKCLTLLKIQSIQAKHHCFGEYNLEISPRSLTEWNFHLKSSTIQDLLIFFLSFFSGNIGATKFKKVAQALNETKFFLPPYRWKRPFKSNAHGNVFNMTSKTTLKPPWQIDFSHVWLKTKNLALAGRQPMQFVRISIFIFCVHML